MSARAVRVCSRSRCGAGGACDVSSPSSSQPRARGGRDCTAALTGGKGQSQDLNLEPIDCKGCVLCPLSGHISERRETPWAATGPRVAGKIWGASRRTASRFGVEGIRLYCTCLLSWSCVVGSGLAVPRKRREEVRNKAIKPRSWAFRDVEEGAQGGLQDSTPATEVCL